MMNTQAQAAPPLRILISQRGASVETPFSDAEAIALLEQNQKQFAQKLWKSSKSANGLTPDQMVWAHILAVEAQKGEVVEPPVMMPGIVALLKKASKNLKNPQIEFDLAPDKRLRLSVAGKRSKNPGSINVSNGGGWKTDNIWYGRIDGNGFEKSRYCEDWVVAFLKKLDRDPQAVAKSYGALTGKCCFCNSNLSNDRSTDLGYGPVCAKNFGLPW